MVVGASVAMRPRGVLAKKADLDEIWLVDVFDGFYFFGSGGGNRAKSHRSAAKFFNDGAEDCLSAGSSPM